MTYETLHLKERSVMSSNGKSNGNGNGNGNGAGKIPLAPLYERVNLEGRRYLVGRIGTAKLLLIETEELSKGERVWQSFLCQGPICARGRGGEGGAMTDRRQAQRHRRGAGAGGLTKPMTEAAREANIMTDTDTGKTEAEGAGQHRPRYPVRGRWLAGI